MELTKYENAPGEIGVSRGLGRTREGCRPMPVYATCAACSSSFRITPNRKNTAKYCSQRCYDAARGVASRVARTCRQCGCVDMVEPSYASRPFCSRECYADSLRGSGNGRDPEKRQVSMANYRARNRERLNRRQAEYIKRNPDVSQNAREARIARKKHNTQAPLRVAEWRAIKERYGHRCAYCGISPRRLEQDHVIPLSRGGAHEAANVVPACRRCNAMKGSKTPEEWGRPCDWDEIYAVLKGDKA